MFFTHVLRNQGSQFIKKQTSKPLTSTPNSSSSKHIISILKDTTPRRIIEFSVIVGTVVLWPFEVSAFFENVAGITNFVTPLPNVSAEE
ncbi:hypothetical protein BN7_6690 [Wickerhamomyces ciferrii]|uniref:Uncharacterized protein n=1 Tax=Wickerhamomyces ciferrii (strain ATCC 14091 / BCRC 22168 / CBS 111 / JCM 3599 / NBRC 0793 / NRRL Y-1031 F-60-10) TaxID=1206466 RepID=K0KV15_WICCF|nr:uncharacterized protein BN7_6690 [Wickerhamomyces ciferrii]CCH47081.1 hypothetical protein BN7_6690 [Wickerhamomyces ciferrii]